MILSEILVSFSLANADMVQEMHMVVLNYLIKT